MASPVANKKLNSRSLYANGRVRANEATQKIAKTASTFRTRGREDTITGTSYLGLRLGGHLSAAIWISITSHGSRPLWWVGLPLAVILTCALFLTPALPEKVAFLPLVPTALL
jgi:hypothetical protein